jgi:hypothetical protein
MHDPRPVRVLLLLQLLALLWLTAWWMSLSAGQRLTHLHAVQAAEQVPTVVPATMVAQAEWLGRHRLGQLYGLLGLVVLAALVGVGEGLVRRRQDVYGGFLLRWWTAGVLGAALLPSGVGAYLVVPWPFPSLWITGGLTALVGVTCFSLMAGRPFIP